MKTKAPKDIDSYKKHYSDSGFWRKVNRIGKKALKPALLLYYVMKSSDTPIKIKGLIAGALGYLILPTDLIPDLIPILGYSDDLSALLAIIKLCKDYITDEIESQVSSKLDNLLGE